MDEIWKGRAKAFDGKWYPAVVAGRRYSRSDPIRVESACGLVSHDVPIELFRPYGCDKRDVEAMLSDLTIAGYWRVFILDSLTFFD